MEWGEENSKIVMTADMIVFNLFIFVYIYIFFFILLTIIDIMIIFYMINLINACFDEIQEQKDQIEKMEFETASIKKTWN